MISKFKQLLLIIALAASGSASAQALTNGSLGIQLGYDFAAHGTITETTVLGIKDLDSSGAVTNMFNANVQYSFASWFSAGLEFDLGAYVEDTADTGADGNKFNTIAFDARLYPVNRDKFNWYVGGQGGLTNLTINRVDPATTLQAEYKYSSPHLGLFTGVNWYLADVAGLFFQLNYSGHDFELNKLSLDGINQDLTYIEQNLQTKGIGVRVGLTVHLN